MSTERSEVQADKPVALSEMFPDELVEQMSAAAGEWAVGVRFDPWRLNGNPVIFNAIVEQEMTKTAAQIMLNASKSLNRHSSRSQWDLIEAIDRAVSKHIRSLVDAARLPPKFRCWSKKIADQAESAKKKIADETRSVQAQLAQLRRDLRTARENAGAMCALWNYPDVPDAQVACSFDGDGIPSASGIYFVWNSERVAYVGQSVNLKQRARLGHHERIEKGDRVSWLEFPVSMLNFAESFYIGITMPPRNFGRRARGGEQ